MLRLWRGIPTTAANNLAITIYKTTTKLWNQIDGPSERAFLVGSVGRFSNALDMRGNKMRTWAQRVEWETGRMLNVYVFRILFIEEDGRSRRYGVMEYTELDARGYIERYLADERVNSYEILETRPARPGEVAALNFALGGVKLLN